MPVEVEPAQQFKWFHGFDLPPALTLRVDGVACAICQSVLRTVETSKNCAQLISRDDAYRGGRFASPAAMTERIGPFDHVRGRRNAPIVLIEYGDYRCPRCVRARHVVDIIRKELDDAVCVVFRNFPSGEIHPDAHLAAEAAESVAARAGEQAFWMMHDILYENTDALNIDDLLSYATFCGADPLRVADDLSSHALAARIEEDVRRGRRDGVHETPAFFVNGRRLDGDWMNLDAFLAALQAAMPS